jgi:hypothetical protein
MEDNGYFIMKIDEGRRISFEGKTFFLKSGVTSNTY